MYRPGIQTDRGQVIPGPLECYLVLSPKLAEQPDLLLNPAAASRIRHPKRLILDLVPANSDAQAQTTVGQQVELCCLLRHQDGLTLRENEDAGGEPDAAGPSRNPREEDKGLVEGIGEIVQSIPAGPRFPRCAHDVVEHQQVRKVELLSSFDKSTERVMLRRDLNLRNHHADAHAFTSAPIVRNATRRSTLGASALELPVRVVVTGALGFVGVNIIRHLAAARHTVIAVDRAPVDKLIEQFLGPEIARITFVATDLTRGNWATRLPRPAPDLAVHTAALTPLGAAEHHQAVEATQVNVAGTARVVGWAAANGLPHVIHLSTGSVYGPVDGGAPVDETVPHNPNTVYGITKSAGERLGRRLAELAGLGFTVLRLSHIYGPMERASAARGVLSPVERWTRALVNGTPVEAPKAYELRDFLHVTDVARAVSMLIESGQGAPAVYNVSSGRLTSEVELMAHLRAIEPGLEVTRAAGEGAPSVRRPALSIERIGREVGWRPTIELTDGLRSYVEWRRATGG